jgi:hypothetical protein
MAESGSSFFDMVKQEGKRQPQGVAIVELFDGQILALSKTPIEAAGNPWIGLKHVIAHDDNVIMGKMPVRRNNPSPRRDN